MFKEWMLTLKNTVVLKIKKELLGTSKDVMLIYMYLSPYDSNVWTIMQNGHGIDLLKIMCNGYS